MALKPSGHRLQYCPLSPNDIHHVAVLQSELVRNRRGKVLSQPVTTATSCCFNPCSSLDTSALITAGSSCSTMMSSWTQCSRSSKVRCWSPFLKPRSCELSRELLDPSSAREVAH